MKTNALVLLLIASMLTFIGCNNNRIDRLSAGDVCDPDADLASFELLEGEAELFELVTSGLPTDNQFETTGFTLTKLDGDIISTFNPLGLFSDEPGFRIECAGGFALGQPASGSFTFTVPALSPEQELIQFDYSVNYDSERASNGIEVFDTTVAPVLTPLTGIDILGSLNGLGYETNLYTRSEGNDRNRVFIIHARDLVQNITLRLRMQELEQ
jgi:hypothetical protein